MKSGYCLSVSSAGSYAQVILFLCKMSAMLRGMLFVCKMVDKGCEFRSGICYLGEHFTEYLCWEMLPTFPASIIMGWAGGLSLLKMRNVPLTETFPVIPLNIELRSWSLKRY